jgi:hypothetical protein
LLDKLVTAGLKTACVSTDAATLAQHEANRGLTGVRHRIRQEPDNMPELGMTTIAHVTMSRLIGDYRSIVPMLRVQI